jgi:thiamine-monophosphate kinase
LRLSSLGEFGFIARIAAKAVGQPGLLLGIGDDTAITRVSDGMVLLATTDLLTEGVHFDHTWSDPVTLGRKSLAVNLSDIAAMGGIPRFALLSLAIPPELPLEYLDSFIDGFVGQAADFGVCLIGGDTSAASAGLTISVTLLGEQSPEKVVRRSGAGISDLICVSGTVGDAALGLRLLRSGLRTGAAVRRHLDPVPRVGLGQALAADALPTAMIDISDGLAADLEHILKASGRGAELNIDLIPRSAAFKEAITAGRTDYYDLPLAGGEDYELLFTLRPADLQTAQELAESAGTTVTAIGRITAESGLVLTRADGSVHSITARGHDHFAANLRGR